MSNIGLRDREMSVAERGREFWRGVLVAGGFTVLPRWTREPVAGLQAGAPARLRPASAQSASARLAEAAASSTEQRRRQGYGGQPSPEMGAKVGVGEHEARIPDQVVAAVRR